jgi:F-type H+-transporting ATPase subunit b
MRRFLFKPVTEFMEKRSRDIENNIEAANKMKEEALKLRGEYEKQLGQIRDEAQGILKEAHIKGERNREEIIKEAKRDADELIKRAEKEIDRAKDKAMSQLREQIVSISLLAAGKVIEKNLDEKTHKDIVVQFIEEVDESCQN